MRRPLGIFVIFSSLMGAGTVYSGEESGSGRVEMTVCIWLFGGAPLWSEIEGDTGALEGIFYERRQGIYLWPDKKLVEKERRRLQKTENSKWGTRAGDHQLGQQEKDGTRKKSWEGSSWTGCRLSIPAQGKLLDVSFTIWPLKEKEHLLRKISADTEGYYCKVENRVCGGGGGVLNNTLKNSVCLKKLFLL